LRQTWASVALISTIPYK